MLIKYADGPGNSIVTIDQNEVNGYYTVLARDASGEVVNKITCDTYDAALDYFALNCRELGIEP